MCGYCIESAVFADILAGERLDTNDLIFRLVHLQEASDWRSELQSWDLDEQGAGAFIALCRFWSERVAGISRQPLNEVLTPNALDSLENWLGNLACPPEWSWVLSVEGCPPSELPMELAKRSLGSYIDGWLQRADPDPSWNYKSLYEQFISLSVALDILAIEAPGDELLIALATRAPGRTPYFDALDLWLKRRALHMCVGHFGVRFIEEHWEEIEVEAIVSVVMGNLLSHRELTTLHAALQRRLPTSRWIAPHELLQTIQSKLTRSTSDS